jgi:glycerol-3-phosphate dehydrogenase
MTGSSERYDLIVIGGGINGAGIARDAAKRGLSVALFEKDDFCSGTSAWSSRLIHGGLRYLEYFEIPLVYESLGERRYLQRIASNLVKPIRIAIPVYSGAKRGRTLLRLGLAFYDLLSFRKSLPNHDMLDREAALSAEPGLNPEGLEGLARYFDAQVVFAERLVLDNILDAVANGAVARNHSPVIEILESGGTVSGVAWRHPKDDSRHEALATSVINAAGPWVDTVLDTAGVQERDFVGGTKGSHVVVSCFEGAPREAIYVEAEADGRPFFILPWNGLVLIGTTDIRYSGSLDSPRISDAEVDYLLTETNRVFPNARLARDAVHYAYAGVRPLPSQEAGPESAITRKHQIVENTEIASGLYSIIGGKLTTYRSLAEQAVDRVVSEHRVTGRLATTQDDALPGATDLDAAEEALRAADYLTAEGRDRLLGIYGGRSRELLDDIRDGRYPPGTLADGGRVLRAEVAFAIEQEFARSLTDIVYRRLMLGFDADQGRRYYEELADLAAECFGHDDERRTEELARLIRYADSFRVAG